MSASTPRGARPDRAFIGTDQIHRTLRELAFRAVDPDVDGIGRQPPIVDYTSQLSPLWMPLGGSGIMARDVALPQIYGETLSVAIMSWAATGQWFDRHRHDERESFHVLAGALELEVAGERVTLGTGDSYSVEPLVPHRKRALSQVLFAVVFEPALPRIIEPAP